MKWTIYKPIGLGEGPGWAGGRIGQPEPGHEENMVQANKKNP
jgi:hypothetical protein